MTKTKFKQTEIGEIPEDWTVKKISEGLVSLNDNSISKKNTLKIINYYDTSAVYRGKFEKPTKYTLEEAPSRAKRLAIKGDILISTVRPNQEHFGYVQSIEDGDVFSTGFVVITSKKIESKYLYYFLTSQRVTNILHQIAESHTSTYPSFKPEDILKLNIPYPPIDEQQRIAKIISDLDSKIELLQNQNKTLESIGKTIFKQWFVDFEFPNEEGKPYKSSGGEMIESELGEIPKGWTMTTVKDCGKVVCGKTPSTQDKDNFGADYPFITIPDMHNQIFIINTERKLSVKGANTQIKKELPSLSICVSCIATPGIVALTTEPSHTNQQINSIVCDSSISPYFMYLTMKLKSQEIKNMGLGGTATLNLNTGDFERLKIMLPDKTILNKFHLILSPLFDKILNSSREIINLTRTRDLLLPKLMSGKIRVPIEVPQ